MDLEIVNKKNEPLMKRTYFEAKLVFEGKTPSRIDMKKELCHKLGSKENLTVVRKINTNYGSERAVASGYVYETEEIMKNLEGDHTIIRHLTKEEQAAEKEKKKAAKLAAQPTAGKKKK